jgi:hypothetical protein
MKKKGRVRGFLGFLWVVFERSNRYFVFDVHPS